MKRWKVIILCMLLICLSGCSSSQMSSKNKEIKILFSVSQGDTFRNVLAQAAKETAESMGATIDIFDEQGVLEQQVDHIKNAKAQGYDVIVCGPINVDTALELEALAGDLPIIFFNSCPDESRLQGDKYMYVGSDEGYAGQYQGEYILEKFKDKDEINVVILKGERGHSATGGRTDGLKDVLASSGKKINYVFEDFGNWSQEEAYSLFNVFLKTKQDCDIVACNNDSMALGVIDALKEAKKTGVTVIGVDATLDGCKAIENGDMAFTVYQSAKGQGEAAVQTAIALVTKGSAAELQGVTKDRKYVWVDFEKVGPENVKEYE